MIIYFRRNTMDKLLEILESFRCHLHRDNKTMFKFLSENYAQYITTLKESISPSDNTLVGEEMCRMVEAKLPEIECNAKQLLEVLRLHESGRIVDASIKAFETFEEMKPEMMQRYSGAFMREIYYRIRGSITFPIERKELFHIPATMRQLVKTERYSMPGYPCIYLASQAELCWYECGKPEQFTIVKYDIPQEENDYLKLIDFSEKLMPLKHSFFCWFHNEQDKQAVRRYLLKHICTYPLRAACSVVTQYPKADFKEEYIIPQLLLQWVAHDDYFDGIRYESCSSSDEVKSMGGHNIVLVSKSFDADGYDVRFRKSLKLGVPQRFDINKIEVDSRLTDLLKDRDIRETPSLWGLESISDEYDYI